MLRVADHGVFHGQQVGFNESSSVFAVDNALFTGQIFVRLRDCDHEDQLGGYFVGKGRRLSVVVQGRVKSATSMGDCFTGYEFELPFQNVPARWLVSAGLAVIRKIAPTMSEDVLSQRPYFLNPLFQTIQLLNVAQPGEEPEITAWPLSESTSLLGGVFSNKTFDRIARKKYFARRENGHKHMLLPDLVYTMEFYEDKLDIAKFELAILSMRFTLGRYLGPQPLQILGKLGATHVQIPV